MCQHDENGAMGIIINKPMHAENIDEIIQQTALGQINPTPEVYFGGPVNLEMGLFLHDPTYDIEGTLSVSKSISLTSNKQIVTDLKNGNGPEEYRFSFGYVGWGEGQVEREIETLAREAESDVLTIISDAMKAAEELENTSPLDFSQFQAIGQED